MRSTLNLFKRSWLALYSVAAIAFIGYLFIAQRATLDALHLVDSRMLMLSLGLHVGFWLLATIFWRQTVSMATHKLIPLGASFHQLALVAVGKYLPGKIWGFLARGAALKNLGIDLQSVVATAAIEQWVMLMSAGLVSGALLVATRPQPVVVCLGLAGVFIGLTGSLFFKVGAVYLHRLRPSIAAPVNGYVTISLTHGSYFLLLGLHSLMWTILGGVLAAICFAFALQPFTLILLATLVVANTLGFVVGFAAIFAPGGIGVREAVTAAVLLPYMSIEKAAILGLVFRLWITASDALFAILLALLALRSARGQKDNKF